MTRSSIPAITMLALVMLLMTGVSGCASRRGAASPGDSALPLSPGDHSVSLRHGGRDRSYLVRVPSGSATSRPLVLAFHGGGGDAAQFKASAGLDRVADANGFVVVYPNGTGPLPRRLLTWNAGDGCCGYARTNNIDDVGFVAAVLNDVASRVSIDLSRVYATGHSNGGIMSHRIAAERADLVAAVVPVAGALDQAHFAPSSPVATLQIHSADDPRALYAGGLGPPFPGTNNRVQHQPVEQALGRWITVNGCDPAPDTLEVRTGTGGNSGAAQRAVHLVWRGCRDGVEVAHWRLEGVGHGWPGDRAPAGGEALVGPATQLVDAADEVWRFVSRFRRTR